MYVYFTLDAMIKLSLCARWAVTEAIPECSLDSEKCRRCLLAMVDLSGSTLTANQTEEISQSKRLKSGIFNKNKSHLQCQNVTYNPRLRGIATKRQCVPCVDL